MSLNLSEKLLLCNFEDDLCTSDAKLYLQKIWKGNWEEILTSDLSSDIFDKSEHELQEFVKNCDNQEEIFCLGLASFLTFIQSNYCGPPVSEILTIYLNERNCNDSLKIDDEEVNGNVTHSKLLNLSKTIFQYCLLDNVYINSWWNLRYIMVHQSLLDEFSQTLYNKAKKIIEKLTAWELNDKHLKSRLEFEIAQFYLLFERIIESEKHINIAKELLGITFELSGELGRRTKYQEKQVAQMILKVKLDDNKKITKAYVVPQIMKLDDDVRLNEVEYSIQQDIPQLSILEQISLLTTVQLIQRSRPKDELLLEESETYLSFILQQNNTWSLRTIALLLRCHLESNHKRTIERSLMQCEAIVGDFRKSEPANIHRIQTIWCLSGPPKWKVESQMADLMLNLGLVKASLEVYLRLQLWEEVIVCYTVLKMRHKAAEIIKQQLNEIETVKLWCLLGDATDDEKCYEKAWELSECKSARAQRHWGQFLFAKKEYGTCIPHLQKSLDINSLQNMVWLRLGYAALSIEDWKLAASCYRRYTSLEPGTFEAWNNLAKAYIKLGEKTRAHFALQEALKYSFDNWKVWDNFMVVSADIAHFDDVVRSYHQILDIKIKHLDLEVLFVLVKYVITSADEQKRLITKTRELFGRLVSLYPNESKLWEMYADIAPNADLRAQRLYGAYRGLVQGDWSKDPIQTDKVLDICIKLGKESLEADTNTLSNTRMTLRAAINAAKKQNWEQNQEKLADVENILEAVLNQSNKQ